MPTETKFIIALCPATPIYLVKQDVPASSMFSSSAATVATEYSRVKTDALVFDTFDAAMEVCRDIRGWGGAQRVEQIAVEVEPPVTNTVSPVLDLLDALRGLATEQKIVAMANALIEAGIVLCRDNGCATEDLGERPAEIYAIIPQNPPNWGSATVLTIESHDPEPSRLWITDDEIRRLDLIVAASLKPKYSGWNIIDINGAAYCELETVGHIEIPSMYTVTNTPVVIERKNLS
jgi:hypothetical protein